MEIIIIAVLILINGFFAMAEIAIVSSKKTKIEREARLGVKGAAAALKLINKPEDFLSSVQIGITLVGIIAGAYGGIALAEDLVPFFQNLLQTEKYAFEVSFLVVVGAITYFSLIIGELVPKTIAFNNPERIAVNIAPVMSLLSIIAKPIVILLSWSTKLILKILFIKPRSEQPVSEEELKIMLEHGAKHGAFDKYEAELVKSIFRFGDRDAYSIMTNRQDLVWIDINDPAEVIKNKLDKNKFSHYPVCEKKLDNILGIVNTQSLLLELNKEDKFNLRKLVQDPIYIPDSLPSFKIIEKFKTENKYVAIVVDEFGTIEGIITKQDLLENIIGVLPESSGALETTEILKRADGTWLVGGSVHIDELIEKIDLNLIVDEDKYVTLGGFIMSRLGKIPVEGDKFEFKGFCYEVIDMDDKRVDKVLVSMAPLDENLV